MDDAAVPDRTGFSREVIAAAAATAVGAVVLVPAFGADSLPTGALYLIGWPALGLVAAVLLDRDPASRLGRSLVALALVPVPLVVLAFVSPDPDGVWGRLGSLARSVDVVIVLLALAVIGWAVGYAPDRMSRRRLTWVALASSAVAAAVFASSLVAGDRTTGLVTTLALIGLAGLLLRLETAAEFRPVEEPLLDVLVVLVAVLVGVATGLGVRATAGRLGLPQPEASGVFTAVLVAALVWPAAQWLRRVVLERRYGTGTLSAQAVAAVTAQLRPDTDPRVLLGRAEATIAAASGHPEVRLVIGPDDVEAPAGWVEHPLVVGGERAGTLALRPRHPEGPEPRQQRVIVQLLPTVALMTRAVGLAVEAEQARRDVARERDAERSRILGDLHDGLGPTLAGMSMRVQAEVRRRPTPLLTSLASELADARDDLRGVVSGLTPTALDGTGLVEALERLVDTFHGDGSRVVLDLHVADEPSAEVGVAAYRSVAEGVTNALRHGRADRVVVEVRSSRGTGVLVDVRDDGAGGPVVPGVGLTSLRRRAELLGGCLIVEPGDPRGVHLRVELPDGSAA